MIRRYVVRLNRTTTNTISVPIVSSSVESEFSELGTESQNSTMDYFEKCFIDQKKVTVYRCVNKRKVTGARLS